VDRLLLRAQQVGVVFEHPGHHRASGATAMPGARRMVYAVEPMPRPRSLTSAAIAAAALQVIDRDGLPALSMRTVAAELGVGAMSLYRYFGTREELERAILDLVLGAVNVRVPAATGWSRRIAILAERIRKAVSAHPGVVPLLMTHRHSSPTLMRCAEPFLAALTEAGFAGRQRVIALRALISFMLGALQAQHLGPLSGTGTIAMATRAAGQFPLLAETARDARRVSADDEFRLGLDLLIRGLVHGQRSST
jgi:AcrR family transcriptional regulator